MEINKDICNFSLARVSWNSKVMLMETVSFVNGFGSHHKEEEAKKHGHEVEKHSIE